MTNVVDLFEKDKNTLEKLIERLKKEDWQLKNSTNGCHTLEKNDVTLTICLKQEEKTITCEYKKGQQRIYLSKEYRDNFWKYEWTSLIVYIDDIEVVFRQRKDCEKEIKTVEIIKDGIILHLPEEFHGSYTVKFFWLWTSEIFDYIRFPEPFVEFFKSVYNEAKSLVEGLKVNKMSKTAFILNALIWFVLKELSEKGQTKSMSYEIREDGVLNVKVDDELRITYEVLETTKFVEKGMWIIDQNGSIKKEGIGDEEIDKALELCRPAINYFIHLSKNKRR